MIAVQAHARIPIATILLRVLRPPLRERAFWTVQTMVVVWAALHIWIDTDANRSSGIFPTGLPIDLLLIPVGYAALRYGLSGAAATTLWGLLLWLPDLILPRGEGHRSDDLVQLAIVVIVALIVGLEIERAHLERASAEHAEAERRAAELHYRLLFAANASPILLVDAGGLVAEANPAAVALWGPSVGSRASSLLGIASDDLVDGRSSRTSQLRSATGEERDYRVSVTRLAASASSPLRQVVLEDVTEEHRARSRARAWAGEVMRAQEEERRRIAREIHDDPLQRLIQLARRMEALGTSGPGADADRSTAAREELLDVVASLRSVAGALRPAALEQLGLVAAVRSLLTEVEEQQGMQIEFALRGEQQHGPADTELGVFRIVQEAVRNAVQHARASRLSIELAYGDGTLRATVSDDGIGFDQSSTEAISTGHFGVLGMRERASLLDGQLEVTSTTGHGTVVALSVPLEARTPAS